MGHYISTVLSFAWLQLKRCLRDPIVSIVLFGIPVVLLLIFGTLLGNPSGIKLRVAVINSSQTTFAADFEKALKNVDVIVQPDKSLSLDEARTEMKEGRLDGIIELPQSFGQTSGTTPVGTLKLYYDETDAQTSEIVAGVVRSVVDGANQQITQTPPPISIERETVNSQEVRTFDGIYAAFTGLAIMMVGVFGVAGLIPADKKSGALRRLHVTPLGAGQLLFGTMLAFAALAVIAVVIMALMAIFLFNLDMRGDWLIFGVFIAVSLVMMLGFGLAIASLAKNSTQADIMGQVVFLASLAVGGVWFPRVLMPEFLQNITFLAPLTPVIEGLQAIIIDGASLAALAPELLVIGGWCLVVYFVGIRMFRWE